MKIEDIKKIAKVSILKNTIDPKIRDFVMTNLTKSELRIFLLELRTLIQRNTVTVIGAEIPKKLKTSIAQMYKKKNIVFVVDESMGAGIKIIDNDTITDLSIKNYISNTVEKLKESL